jgi:hypothetical protein
MQGMLLHMLAQAAPSKTLVEVGTLGGYSAAWLAVAISGSACGRLHSIERDAKRAAFAQQNLEAAGLASQVQVLNEAALIAIPQLCATMEQGSVGLVFLDAQKSEYISYFQQLERLVAPVSCCCCTATFEPLAHALRAGWLGGGRQLPRHKARVDRYERSISLCFIASGVYRLRKIVTLAAGAGHSDATHMHDFNDFMARQRRQWDVV